MRTRSAPALWALDSGVPPTGRFVALAPGEGAPLLPVTLPPGLRGAARLAVARRQLRDRLGSGAASLDLRPAPLGTPADAWSTVLAADPADMTRWRAALGAGRHRAVAIIPDYLALPQSPGLWVLAADDRGRIRARLGPTDGFAAESGLAAVMLTQARARSAAPRAVLLTEGALPQDVAAALEGLLLIHDISALPPGLPAPRILALGELGLDLRRDPATRAAALAAQGRALVLPLTLLAVGLAGWAGSVAIETVRLHDQAAALDRATLEAVRRDLLPQGPILDIRLQVAREIAQRQQAAPGRGGDGALDLMHRAARGLADAGVVPQTLSVTPGSGAQLDLTVADFAALDAIVAALRGAGLEVGVTRSGTVDGGQVGAGLTLSLAGGDGP